MGGTEIPTWPTIKLEIESFPLPEVELGVKTNAEAPSRRRIRGRNTDLVVTTRQIFSVA